MLKVLILANNQKWNSWDAKIKQLWMWFSPAIGLSIDIIHTKFNKIPFESYGIIEGQDRKGVSKSWFKENITNKYPEYDIVILSLNRKDWKGFPIEGWQWDSNCITIASNENGEYQFHGIPYDGGKWFNLARHELCHALYTKQGKVDRTHEHWESKDLASVLVELSGGPETVTVTRTSDDGKQTLGILNVNGLKLNTLEKPWLNNKPNVSCIPKGTYNVKWTFSPKLLRYTYEVQNVPGRSGIRFHKGNYFYDIAGCILLGNGYKDLNNDGELDIINSTDAIKQFELWMENKDFKLIIN